MGNIWYKEEIPEVEEKQEVKTCKSEEETVSGEEIITEEVVEKEIITEEVVEKEIITEEVVEKEIITEVDNSDQGYSGFVIKTAHTKVEIRIAETTGNYCCESISVEHTAPSLYYLVGKEVVAWKHQLQEAEIPDHVFTELGITPQKDRKISSGRVDNYLISKLTVLVEEENEDYYLMLNNNHNGYYAHRAEVLVDDEIVIGTWL